jgi:hypothetical protein
LTVLNGFVGSGLKVGHCMVDASVDVRPWPVIGLAVSRSDCGLSPAAVCADPD